MKHKIVFLHEKDILNLVKGLADQINHDYKNEKESLLLVCPLKGSVFFLADFVRFLKIPVIIDFILIEGSKDSFVITKDITNPIKNKKVLIIKEVLNEGTKLLFLKKRIEASLPKSIKIVTLIDKPSQRNLDLQSDYFGIETEDRYIFGYGMDHQEQYRQLKNIHLLAQ
ncbi:MAG: hypoxanthine phosphoribosyltransferase [Bdellovibrionales bacterium]|nr:hypoxanthine phosphoribosyltransferase [Bdellovibrionales bacterium]